MDIGAGRIMSALSPIADLLGQGWVFQPMGAYRLISINADQTLSD